MTKLPLSPSLHHADRLSASFHRAIARRRPWPELIDASTFSRPASFAESLARIQKNAAYFHVNYLAVLAAAVAVSLLLHPISFLALLSLLSAWISFYLLSDRPLVLFGCAFSDREAAFALAAITVLVVFVTDIVALTVRSVLVGTAVVCAHGAVRVPVDVILDGGDSAGFGVFYLINGGAAAPSRTPAIIFDV